MGRIKGSVVTWNVIQANRMSGLRMGGERIPTTVSDMQSEKACNHKDYD